MSFGVSPVNYSDSDSETLCCQQSTVGFESGPMMSEKILKLKLEKKNKKIKHIYIYSIGHSDIDTQNKRQSKKFSVYAKMF